MTLWLITFYNKIRLNERKSKYLLKLWNVKKLCLAYLALRFPTEFLPSTKLHCQMNNVIYNLYK